MGSSDLLGLTISLTSSTLIVGVVAGLMPRLVGDEPNPVVGIRTKATMSSPEAWQLAHRLARPLVHRTVWTAVAGLCLQIVIGVVTGFGSVVSAVAAPVVFLVVIIILIYAGARADPRRSPDMVAVIIVSAFGLHEAVPRVAVPFTMNDYFANQSFFA